MDEGGEMKKNIIGSIGIILILLSSGCLKDNGTPEKEFIDTDGDGLEDELDPNPFLNIDTDQDGLSDDLEDYDGLDKTNPDTDGDGFKDGEDKYPLDPNRFRDDP